MADQNPPQLILLRHAKSDWHSGAHEDFARPLSGRGLRDAPRMGEWLAAHGYAPDCVISSPAARAKSTAELACAEMGFAAEQINYERDLYHAGAAQIASVAAAHLAAHNRVMLVGHNPGMEMALLNYCPEAPAFADGKLMPTCAAAVIELGDGGAKLLELMRPSML